MRIALMGSIVALVVAGAFGAPSPAQAAHVTVSLFDPGVVGFGYSDGYWDRSHQWHGWAHPSDARAYREHNREHYVAHRHTRERDGGYRNEWWNEHH